MNRNQSGLPGAELLQENIRFIGVVKQKPMNWSKLDNKRNRTRSKYTVSIETNHSRE